jgi:hypothetical protein
LWVKPQFGTTALANEVWTALAIDRIVRSMSVGFFGNYTPEYGHWDKEMDLWVWSDLQLFEISTVGLPACASAQFQMSRAMGLPMLRSFRATELSPFHGNNSRPWDRAKFERQLATEATDSAYLLGRDLPVAEVVDGKLRLSWQPLAISTAQLLGGRGGLDESLATKKQLFKAVESLYAKFQMPVPTWKGEWPKNFRDVSFHAGEPELLQDSLVLENSRTVLNGAQSLLNIVRHWRKSGRGPSPELAEAMASSIAIGSQVLQDCELTPAAQGEVEQAVRLLESLTGDSAGAKTLMITR